MDHLSEICSTNRIILILIKAALTVMPISSLATGNAIRTGTSATHENDEKEIKTYYLEAGESSWVPIISAGVIVLLVFAISIFACCLHCPGCCIHHRGEPNRIV